MTGGLTDVTTMNISPQPDDEQTEGETEDNSLPQSIPALASETGLGKLGQTGVSRVQMHRRGKSVSHISHDNPGWTGPNARRVPARLQSASRVRP